MLNHVHSTARQSRMKLKAICCRLGTTLFSREKHIQNSSSIFNYSVRCIHLLNFRAKMSGDLKCLYNVVFVLGGPGSGKGTQCKKIQQEFGFQHLSAGELLRNERSSLHSQFKEEIEKYMKDGSIVPVKITCSLLRREMKSSLTKDFVIDGFPRNRDNLDGWSREMTEVSQVKRVLFLDCSDQVCVDRCVKRGLTSGRFDDNAESLEKRILQNRESSMPIVEHYRSLNLVSTINGDRPPSEVFEDVKKIFLTEILT